MKLFGNIFSPAPAKQKPVSSRSHHKPSTRTDSSSTFLRCICPHCGRKLHSNELCFDLSKVFAEHSDAFRADLSSDQFKDLLAKIGKHHTGPAFFSEQDLCDYYENNCLTIKADNWKKALNSYYKANEATMDGENKESLKKLIEFQASDFCVPLKFTKESVDEYDPVRIGAIRDEDGEMIADTRHCPYCGGELSYWAGRYPEIVITVVGGPRVSKSTTLAACADAFLSGRTDTGTRWEGHGVQVGENFHGDAGWGKFLKTCLEPYRKGQRLLATQENKDEIPRFSVKVTFDNRNYVLTVIDLPGEYTKDTKYLGIKPEMRAQYERLYRNVNCFWYCTDSIEWNQQDIFSANAVDALEDSGYEAEHKLTPNDQLKMTMKEISEMADAVNRQVPVVLILGKSDIVDRNSLDLKTRQVIYREDYAFGGHDGNHCIGKYRGSTVRPALFSDKFCQNAFRLRKYLSSTNPDLLKEFEECFPVHTYLAVSNYGFPPKPNGEASQPPAPFQTDLPFFWMMSILGQQLVMEEGGHASFFARNDERVKQNLGMYGSSKKGYRNMV